MDLPDSQVWSQLVTQLADPDDYVGLMDDADNVLQISRDTDTDGYLVELPLPDERQSLCQVMAAAELRSLLETLPRRFRAAEFDGFAPKSW